MEKKPQDLEQEFTRIAREYKDTIYMVCYMFSQNTAEVDDLYQEILINMWRSLPSFEGRSSLKTWIWRLSLNTCISYDRKRSSKGKALPLDMQINLYEDTDHDSKQIKMLHERINRLGVFDRAIIMLWLENMPYEEIGAIVGISAKNVGVRLVRIREQLKNMK
ncbi:MAG: sigma-70 family RNA polymerase sigma factor [Alistipes sp.]|nr:sigma-70 family RNA polymerase sigma factor [Alistipes sp.]MBQ1957479.1 sigma-70 family RNA polymerase sigma factor [Alistipes sp.]MBQ1980077.1 sigma-70 family RNA polymerase sigma factor [Alistipes sp.]MBQ2416249.1 sigma-70 family RNA polymerase sigma factor [Alistipes sp.]MBQ5623952.1 sigma-70 family RNA polymerase sigma factor [Alistipes sp.]